VYRLGIDGALGAFSAALVRDDDPAFERTAVAHGNDALERGIAIVDQALGEVRLAELGGIAVGLGPGSFTGLRIALSYAKSFAFASGVPLVGVSSYDASTPPDAPPTHATFVHGRVGIACVRYRAPETETILCGPYDALAEMLAAHVARGAELTCYGIPEGATRALGERQIIVRSGSAPTTIPALSVVRRAVWTERAAQPHALRADYGEAHYAERDPETRSG
jgi:tRNA threonylcarbamoyladenosine biosynthesis protein TsaB